MIVLNVNGKEHRVEAAPDTPLLWVLREQLRLTGTKYCCGEGLCGACTVLIDGRRVVSCLTLAVQTDGRSVTTIEGLAKDGKLHPLQEAFSEHHGLQCGYCTPGMLMSALYLLEKKKQPTQEEIRKGIQGNVCRCTGYANIFTAIEAAAQKMRESA